MLFILFIFIHTISSQTTQKQIFCPPGCSGACHSDYTCSTDCNSTFENDGTCMTCKWVDPWNNTNNEFYVEHGDSCIQTHNVLKHDGYYLPYGSQVIDEIEMYKSSIFTINQSSYLDTSPCNHQQHYLFGKWLQIKRSEFNLPVSSQVRMYLHISKIQGSDSCDLYVDVSTSKPQDDYVQCTAQVHLDSSVNSTLLDFTEIAEFKDRTD